MHGTGTRRAGSLAEAHLGRVVHASAAALSALSGREIAAQCSALELCPAEHVIGHVAQPLLLLRMRMTGASGELTWLLGRREAVTLGCFARRGLSDRELLERRLAPVPGSADLDGLRDVAWVLAERGDRTIRGVTGNRVGLTLVEITPLTPESARRVVDAVRARPRDPLDFEPAPRRDAEPRDHRLLRMRLTTAGIPPTDCALLADPDACAVLDEEDGTPSDPTADRAPDPIAQTNGTLHAFASEAAIRAVARQCAARFGLAFSDHPGAAAPNPSVLRDGLVLLDVPPGLDHRFDWCQRLKRARPDVAIALLVHHPSRARVLRGFEAGADAVIGWPADPLDVALRVRRIVDRRATGPTP